MSIKQEYKSRKFLGFIIAVIFSFVLAILGKITATWTACITGLLAVYCGANAYLKGKEGEK